MREYIELVPDASHKENVLVVATGYELGGYNRFTGNIDTRGYYLYAYPIIGESRDDDQESAHHMEAHGFLRGCKYLLKAVSRQSQKAAAEAEIEAEKQCGWMVEKVCQEYGLTIKTEET